MAQVKKSEVRDAILVEARTLFAKRGYARTSLAQIAARANVSTANIYVYFDSKLAILYAIYDPWMRERLEQLERELQTVEGSYERVRHILRTLWRDIPREENGFARNVMQALATYEPGDGYRPTLLRWMEAQLAVMIHDALPASRRRQVGKADLAHLVVMAFDGFILYHGLDPDRPCDDATLDLAASLLTQEAVEANCRRKKLPRASPDRRAARPHRE